MCGARGRAKLTGLRVLMAIAAEHVGKVHSTATGPRSASPTGWIRRHQPHTTSWRRESVLRSPWGRYYQLLQGRKPRHRPRQSTCAACSTASRQHAATSRQTQGVGQASAAWWRGHDKRRCGAGVVGGGRLGEGRRGSDTRWGPGGAGAVASARPPQRYAVAT